MIECRGRPLHCSDVLTEARKLSEISLLTGFPESRNSELQSWSFNKVHAYSTWFCSLKTMQKQHSSLWSWKGERFQKLPLTVMCTLTYAKSGIKCSICSLFHDQRSRSKGSNVKFNSSAANHWNFHMAASHILVRKICFTPKYTEKIRGGQDTFA